MTLCAVFLAIFFPATLVELGCFLLGAPVLVLVFFVEPAEPFDVGLFSAGSLCGCDCLGFIWMMVLDRVGGGGSEKLGLVAGWMCFGVAAGALLRP